MGLESFAEQGFSVNMTNFENLRETGLFGLQWSIVSTVVDDSNKIPSSYIKSSIFYNVYTPVVI